MAKKKSSKSRKSGRSRSGGNGSAKQAAGKQLVIVESPAKARTINRYLGDDYVVMASVGHIRDLPKRNPKGVKAPVPGVDVEHDFEPTYEIIHGKGTTVTELKRAAKTADGVWLATDLDREGEAIAWHLAEALDVNLDQAKRVVFNAITSDEIRRAFERPREIDLDKVSAQQARRILDRIVGYQVSPLLWKKVAGGLSAGRVQSVAVRLIVEREREIRDFVPDEYWRILGSFTLDTEKVDDLAAQWRQWLADQAEETKKHKTPPRGQNGVSMRARNGWLAEHQSLSAELIEVGGEKFSADNADRALEVAQMAGFVLDDREDREDPDAKGPAKNKVTLTGHVDGGPDWRVQNIETKRTRSRPNAPFITSTMQQAASNAMNFSASRTMRTAQQLYEGVEVGNLGSVGLITYMRTDSTHISGEALNAARKFITQKYGEKYLPEKPNFFGSTNKQAQEAHEAIRPTDVTLSPDDSRLKAALSKEQLALYSLIWKRFVGSQMIPAEWDATTLRIAGEADGTEIVFKATGRVLVEKGFYLVTGVPNTADDPVLPQVEQDQPVAALEIDPQQMFTNPPPRYSEASLVKKLEAEGIGRPSTYAQIIQVIQNRKYVEKISGRFHATDLGEVVTDKLIEGFPGIMDVGYTRWMEDELDAVEEQHRDWVQFLHSFYKTFQDNLAQAHEEMSHAKAETEPSEYECPTCGAACVYRFGQIGRAHV